MFTLSYLLMFAVVLAALAPAAEKKFESDVIKTSAGDLTITFIGHGTLMFTFNKLVIHVDPWTRLDDYAKLPKADIVLVTHEHTDHLDTNALAIIKTASTEIILTEACRKIVGSGTVMKNGDTVTIHGIRVEAVPAYNIVHKRDNGQPFHPKGDGNGYVLTIGDKRIYIAGDTENIPEMKNLIAIDYAFLPMNLPYTMTPEMVVDAVKMFHPKVLYPYHTGDTNTGTLVKQMKNHKGTEVRIRIMQ